MANHDPGAVAIAALALQGATLRALVTSGALTQGQADDLTRDVIVQVTNNPDAATRDGVLAVFRDIGMITADPIPDR